MKDLEGKGLFELRTKKAGILFVLFTALIFLSHSCMNVRKSETIGDMQAPKEKFVKKTIAVLPVKTQTSLATDSLLSLRMAVNDKLDDKIREKINDARIINAKETVNILNDKGKIELLDDIIKTYENTGVFDKRLIETLGHMFNSHYIVFSRLKAEKMAVSIIGKGFGASLEVAIIDNVKNEIVWAGSGEFKRGGIFGFGTTENKQAAEELVRLAFAKF
ncbi:MAG: DUF4136 domain-containing protein [Thermodesulfovibrionales bacterium]